MAHEPKKRHAKAAKRTRRASIKLASINISTCTNCQSPILSHIACRNCGFYAGKAVNSAKAEVKVTRA